MAFDFKRLKVRTPEELRKSEAAAEKKRAEHHKRLRGMADELQKVERGLTDWECGFVDDMDRRLEREDYVSPKQEEKLQQIWTKIFGA